MAKIYYEQDANIELLKDKTIGIVGYGSQGHAHALNLRDSGCNVMVGLYPGSKSWQQAQMAGLRVGTVEEVAREADIIMILAPDQVQRQVYYDSIEPGLRAGSYVRLDVPPAASLALPLNNASAQPLLPKLGWQKTPGTISAVGLARAGAVDPEFVFYTAASSFTVPSTLPLAPSTAYTWWVVGFGPHQDLDAFAAPGGGVAFFGLEEPALFAVSERHAFTTGL
jgi:hypothetical protein